MIKKLIGCIRKIIVSFLVLYGFNLLVSSINIYVPINVLTVGVVSFLGMPGLLSLVVMYFIVK